MSVLIAAWCAFAVAVAAGCLVPADRLPGRLPNDKLLHLLCYALPPAALAPTSGRTAAGAAALLLLGLAVEVAQHFVPGRSFCRRDLAANAAGVLLGTLAGLAVAP